MHGTVVFDKRIAPAGRSAKARPAAHRRPHARQRTTLPLFSIVLTGVAMILLPFVLPFRAGRRLLTRDRKTPVFF